MLRIDSSQKGFTLIEVLVSTGILAIFLASVAGAYLAQEMAMKMEEEIADMQQNGRIAADYIDHVLRNAGGAIVGGQRASRAGPIEMGIRVPDVVLGLPSSNQFYMTKGVFGINDVPVSNLITQPAFIPNSQHPANPTVSDVLTVIYGGLPMVRLAAKAGRVISNNFQFTYCASEGELFRNGELIIVSNLRNSALYRITSAPSLSGTNSAFCRGQTYVLQCNVNDPNRINRIETKTFYRNDNTSLFQFNEGQGIIFKAYVVQFRMINPALDTTYWNASDPRPTLMVQTLLPDQVNPANFEPAIPLAENIGTLQLRFGFWVPTGGNNVPDQYVRPHPNHSNKILVDDFNFTTVDSASDVRLVEYSILARTEKSDYQKYGTAGGTGISGISESTVLSSGAQIGSYTLSNTRPGYRWRLYQGIKSLRNIYGLKDDFNFR
ncbi:MAG: prepilin-type N-terminal cleavage/methylation domain-containing protein [Deltaproteobacteria bacterium]|nr:prepilin-type N-terminal cleavage/methylation domain-containing protein [Deltaproteobacteria bacterium]